MGKKFLGIWSLFIVIAIFRNLGNFDVMILQIAIMSVLCIVTWKFTSVFSINEVEDDAY